MDISQIKKDAREKFDKFKKGEYAVMMSEQEFLEHIIDHVVAAVEEAVVPARKDIPYSYIDDAETNQKIGMNYTRILVQEAFKKFRNETDHEK